MQIIKDKNNVVLFTGENLELTADKLIAPGWTSPAVNSTTHTLEEADSIPDDFKGGHYTYNGEWIRTAQGTAAHSLELSAVKKQICSKIDAVRDAKIKQGLPYTFPDGDGVIDVRNDVDIRNIQGLASTALSMVVGSDTTDLPFRDQANVTHTMSPPQVVAMGTAVASFVSSNYQISWAHKDAVRALSTVEDVQAYDYQTGWDE